MATLTPAELLYMEEHISDNRGPSVIACTTTCLIIAFTAVALRFWSRRIGRTKFGMDDLTIIFSLICYIIYVTCAFLLVRYGMGRHIILLTDPRHFVTYTISAAVLYNVTIALAKLSILFFYRRIFPQSWFKYVLLGSGIFVIANCITFVFTSIFQCVPISGQWDPIKAKLEGMKCIDYNTVVFTAGFINTFISIAILALPLPLVAKLKLSPAKKRLIMLTFALGGAECIISIVRLAYVHTFKSADATWGNVAIANLTTVELGIGILCACVPAYRTLYNFLIGRGKIDNTRAISGNTGSRSRPTLSKSMGSSGHHKSRSYMKSGSGADGSASVDEEELQLSPRFHDTWAASHKEEVPRTDGRGIVVSHSLSQVSQR